ncbi:MAG: hypothetical protein LKF48_00500 [Prevotella sp.]|nr:hypothetical protein [Prevotella sp.]MCH4181633.1 hypothetical protein [Prevotella sp.]MCH4211907.1 hypothetical protein [Prevotella sp.]MCH4240658.1 hypothetical protein [Prevotella sp.]
MDAALCQTAILSMSGYRCIPSTDGRFAVSLDNGQEKVVDYQTHGRSEEWKQNVIRNFA